MEFPTEDQVLKALKNVRDELNRADDCDVRLQVYPDGAWAVRWGLSDYDQDHRGYWGASSIDGRSTLKTLRAIAADLISQAQDDAAQNGEEV
jgi:hypothetical protein